MNFLRFGPGLWIIGSTIIIKSRKSGPGRITRARVRSRSERLASAPYSVSNIISLFASARACESLLFSVRRRATPLRAPGDVVVVVHVIPWHVVVSYASINLPVSVESLPCSGQQSGDRDNIFYNYRRRYNNYYYRYSPESDDSSAVRNSRVTSASPVRPGSRKTVSVCSRDDDDDDGRSPCSRLIDGRKHAGIHFVRTYCNIIIIT